MTCVICLKPLLSSDSGPFVRVGKNRHAHRSCLLAEQNEEGHFTDAPCVQCHKRLSECQCCPKCAAPDHSNGEECGVCYDYQMDNCGPDPAFAEKHRDEIYDGVVDAQTEAAKERRHEEGVLS